jgi:hypothetical protein
MVIFSTSLSSCGVVQVENGCVLIKKQSEEKRELGTTILGMVDAEKIGDGLTVEDAQAEGYKYLIEGTQLVVDNPRCFTADEVRIAKNLLGQ